MEVAQPHVEVGGKRGQLNKMKCGLNITDLPSNRFV